MTDQRNDLCPECAGVLMHHLTFDHDPDCALRTADDQTAVNDALRSREQHGAFSRPITPTEAVLIAALMPDMTADLETVQVRVQHNGIHRREFFAQNITPGARTRII